MKLQQKLLQQFTKKELWLELSAISGLEENKMRKTIETCLEIFPIQGKKIAIESGTFHGVSAALLADYFDEVHTFEIERGYVKDKTLHDKVWQYLGISNKIHFHLIKNDKEKLNILKDLNWNFGFIDGNHTCGTRIDFELFNKCGRILFHDYNSKKAKTQKGLWKAVYDYINTLSNNIVYIDEPFVVWIKK
ncbi:MAG: hypothetical protein ACTSWG_13395 [Candidatus Helarchaeota archaeon]